MTRYTIAKGARLKPVEEVKPHEIKDQIGIRRLLQRDMVGWLYPSILEGEIQKLALRIGET